MEYYLWQDLDGDGEMDDPVELISNISKYDFLTENALSLLGTKERNEFMWNSDFYKSTSETKDYTMDVQMQDSKPLFSVKVKTVLSNNLMEIYVSNINEEADDKDNYTLKMTMTPNISEVYSKAEVEEDHVAKIVETKKTVIKWTVNNIEKVMS